MILTLTLQIPRKEKTVNGSVLSSEPRHFRRMELCPGANRVRKNVGMVAEKCVWWHVPATITSFM